MKIDLTTLIERIKAGDFRYFSILVKEYTPILFPIAKYHLMSAYNKEKDIEDALQETWTKVYRYLSVLEEPQKFPGWVTRILKHECLNIQEKNKKYISMHVLIDPETRDDLLSLVHEDDICDQEQINSENINWIIELILQDLDKNYALPLKLFYLDGLSIQKISLLLSISENLVKTRLFRGRQLLKKKILEKIKNS